MIRPIPQQIAFSAVCTKAFGFRSSAFLRICSDRKSRNPTALQKKTTTCLQRFPFRREPRTDAGFQLFSAWWRFGQSSPDGDSCATFSFDSWLTGNVNCRIFFPDLETSFRRDGLFARRMQLHNTHKPFRDNTNLPVFVTDKGSSWKRHTPRAKIRNNKCWYDTGRSIRKAC